jgi:hypothetical protein
VAQGPGEARPQRPGSRGTTLALHGVMMPSATTPPDDNAAQHDGHGSRTNHPHLAISPDGPPQPLPGPKISDPSQPPHDPPVRDPQPSPPQRDPQRELPRVDPPAEPPEPGDPLPRVDDPPALPPAPGDPPLRIDDPGIDGPPPEIRASSDAWL